LWLIVEQVRELSRIETRSDRIAVPESGSAQRLDLVWGKRLIAYRLERVVHCFALGLEVIARHHRFDDALTTIEESVMRMGLDAIDIYLIHWPNPLEDHFVEAWGALIEARDRGLVRHIGVSNFLPEHLERLRIETGEMPALNQIELHPYFPQVEALAYHRENGILTESWSPLGRGSDLLANPTVVAIAAQYAITAAQAVLAWHVHMGSIPIPKSKSMDRLRENIDIFDVTLTSDNIEQFKTLARPDGRLANQDPSVYQEF